MWDFVVVGFVVVDRVSAGYPVTHPRSVRQARAVREPCLARAGSASPLLRWHTAQPRRDLPPELGTTIGMASGAPWRELRDRNSPPQPSAALPQLIASAWPVILRSVRRSGRITAPLVWLTA
ncbi:hypothetical protein ETD86_50155 [Nonomuraea turkmeniaca]|uniref:Uncharacterized protein n=1 Tax=Nonomuraea turkmeniaca TaxID=103838 RepID=A0A5S4EWC4_9ACTN|nr:hypothetical protein [Nonomuraea turkmeniaca]TMR07883.1 hypothetical protein ETD86_50155 [Nonomuraea turkmeniaca]